MSLIPFEQLGCRNDSENLKASESLNDSALLLEENPQTRHSVNISGKMV